MKKLKKSRMNRFSDMLVMAIAAFGLYSCNQSVDLNGTFNEKYILYCLLNGDSTRQKVYLSKSYSVSNYDPFENTNDPSVEGAKIQIIENENTIYQRVYNLIEGATQRTDTSRYKTPLKYYYIDGYKPNSMSSATIKAVLKDGTVLTSAAQIPYFDGFSSYSPYSYLPYNPTAISGFSIEWNSSNLNNKVISSFFLAKLELVYHKAGAPYKKFRIKMPSYFLHQTGNYIPIYQGVTTNHSFSITRESLDLMMRSVSENDPDKNSYIFEPFEFSLTLMDNNLANYLTSEEVFNNEFSLRIESDDYSNIDGGLGVFGSFIKRAASITIAKSYIESFGYKTTY